MPPIDFCYSIGSTYTYLTAMRLGCYAKREGVTFRWRPFNVRAIMREQDNNPFSNKPGKLAYMWRDIERRAGLYDFPIRVPPPFPLENLALANQIALLGMKEGWGEPYTVETYRIWFQDGLPAGSEPNLSESLRRIGENPTRIIEAASTPESEAALAEETEAVKQAGVFGSPNFIVNGEVFWGDDRLDDAVQWYRNGSLRPASK
ncbi:MAG: DsbA family protein [Salinarimonas sp.]|nr:DsbA family protein [Salinarimonas sp.]